MNVPHLFLAAAAAATYQSAPFPLDAILDAPPTPWVQFSPDRAWIALLDRPGLPPVADLTEPEARLAGLRIATGSFGPSREAYAIGLRLIRVADGATFDVVGLPESARIPETAWSPDGRYLAVVHADADAASLWLLDTQHRRVQLLHPGPLHRILDTGLSWLPDSRSLVCRLVPADLPPAPEPDAVPDGPIVQEADGRAAPVRTYQDLLGSPHDETLFDYYLASQVVRIGVDGAVTALGEPARYRLVAPSPDGRYFLVETMHRPYSYLVPASRFPFRAEIRDAAWRLVAVAAEIPLDEERPLGRAAVRTGRRSLHWRADAPATLVWTEARDGGDPNKEAAIRDEVFQWASPFDGDPQSLIRLGLRYGGVTWGHDRLALVHSWWWDTRMARTWRIAPGAPDTAPALLHEFPWEDRYRDPGEPVLTRNAYGMQVIQSLGDGQTLFFAGDGASPEGDRPFLDRVDLAQAATNRLWRSEAPQYEQAVLLLDPDGPVLVTRRESVTEPPNYWVRDLAAGTERALTAIPHPAPVVQGIRKEMIRYARADGVACTAMLYLPPDNGEPDLPRPTLLWAYPEEFKSADAAGQVTDSPYRYIPPAWWSPALWTLLGYAVLDDVTMPVVGEADAEPNDTYVEQLAAGAEAAVAEVVRRGVADPRRIAVGGSSYGAFMAANLLAHTDLFAAGIALSGAYNRTLTPFGFQSEERTLWQAPDTYVAMSPFLAADRIHEPLLLLHGQDDNNPGTYPMQSERLFNALRGLGGTARLVLLPLESHGYRSRESIHHVAWEMARWLDQHLNPAPEDPAAEAVGAP
jgi:dipeptidyl aminopeptidase/acylaminoacyl peptidase